MTARAPSGVSLRRVDAGAMQALIPALAGLLRDCVADGASIGFVMPFGSAGAAEFWTGAVLPGLQAGDRLLLVAFDGGQAVGTGQLVLAPMPNQSHRAEIAKLLVHPAKRRRGIAGALLDTLLHAAADAGRSLVTLDTRSGDPAQALYASRGFLRAGEIPAYAQAPDGSGALQPTTLMYRLRPPGAGNHAPADPAPAPSSL